MDDGQRATRRRTGGRAGRGGAGFSIRRALSVAKMVAGTVGPYFFGRKVLVPNTKPRFAFRVNPKYMREAIRISLKMMRANEGGPFGAVVVCRGKVVGRGWNRVTSTNDPTAHAEVVAIRDA